MEYAKALEAAKTIRAALLPACRKLVIAGSLRRQKGDVKDIEMVALLKPGGLFGDETDMAALETAIAAAINSGALAWDTQLRRNGDKYKRFRAPGLDIAVDFFIADSSANFGNLLAIRTGDSDFSKKLVTKRSMGGLMPSDLRQQDGYLYRDGKRLECETEEAFFVALGLPVVLPPQERNLEGVVRLRRILAEGGKSDA